jgi:hypothetical protein
VCIPSSISVNFSFLVIEHIQKHDEITMKLATPQMLKTQKDTCPFSISVLAT